MRPEVDVYAYVQDLEKHLQLTLFGGGMADPEGAVLLVRGALADGDRDRAAALARRTQRLAMTTPGNPDMAAAAEHARGLIDQDPAALERAAGTLRGRAGPGRRAGGRRERLGRAGRSGPGHDPAQPGLRPVRGARRRRRPGPGTVQPAGRGHPAPPLDPRGPAGLRLGQPDRHRAAGRRPGGPGAQQPAGGEPGIPEHAHRRVPPAPHLLEARHHLPGPAGADRRGAGRRGCLVAVSPAGAVRPSRASVRSEFHMAEPSAASVFLSFLA